MGAKHLSLNTAQKKGHIYLGQPIQSKENNYDITLFEISDELFSQVSNDVKDDNGVTIKTAIFTGTVEDLFGKEVRKLRPVFSNFEVKEDEHTSVVGFVNQIAQRKFLSNLTFLVKGKHGSFAEKGDSGTPIVLYEKNSRVLQIVGFVIGGTTNVPGYDTLCIFLPEAIKYLEKTYSVSLSTELHEHTRMLTKPAIPIGCRIYANIPTEIINKVDLLTIALNFVSNTFESCNVDKFGELLKLEKDLKRKVYNGLVLEEGIQTDNSTYGTVCYGCQAVSLMSKGQRVDSEIDIRHAFECIPKCPEMRLWLVYKTVSCLTQFCALFYPHGSLECLEILFQEAISFSNKSSKIKGFPEETIVKLMAHMSQIYQYQFSNVLSNRETKLLTKSAQKFRAKAILFARKAVTEAKRIHDKKQTLFSATRLAGAKGELAYSLLGCGHFYEGINEAEISEEEIEEAKIIVEDIRNSKEKIFLVQSLLVNIVECDLAFREKRLDEALAIAKKCHALACEKKFYFEIRRAHSRVKYVQSKLTAEDMPKCL